LAPPLAPPLSVGSNERLVARACLAPWGVRARVVEVGLVFGEKETGRGAIPNLGTRRRGRRRTARTLS